MSGKTQAQRVRDWDEAVEDGGAPDEEARKPFDAGIMLVAAEVLDAYGAVVRQEPDAGKALATAMAALRETVEAVIARSEEEDPRA